MCKFFNIYQKLILEFVNYTKRYSNSVWSMSIFETTAEAYWTIMQVICQEIPMVFELLKERRLFCTDEHTLV